MNTKRNLLLWASAALALVASVGSVKAFNQDHYFLYKTVGGLNGVRAIATGPDDKIYVAEYSGQHLIIFDKDLNKLSQISVSAYGVAVSDSGMVYVADPVNDKVLIYDRSGNSLGDLTSGFDAYEVEIHPGNGNIYIRNSGGGFRVCKPDGTLVQSFTLPEGANFVVLRDGKLLCSTEPGKLYNELGILEKSGLPGWGQGIRCRGGYLYTGYRNSQYRGGLYVYNADFEFVGSLPSGGLSWPGNVVAVNSQGDVIYSDYSTVCCSRRCEANSMGPEVRNAAPTAEITSIQQRTNSTLLDIDYTVTDLDNATVQVAAAAFRNNANTLDSLILLDTLVEGTSANVGPAITTGVSHRLTWDVRADWGVDFGDVSVHVFVRDSRPLLMGLHFLNLPANGTNAAITITRCPVNTNAFLEPMMWLAASHNTNVCFTNAQVKGVGGAFDGQLLASGTTVTLAGRQLVESLMGVREATPAEVQAAREASTPGNVNQWDLTDNNTMKIDQTYPLKVNEYGFDTGTYDGTWFWLVKVN